MKLLLIATILAAASASPRLGSAKCSWGPAYWCQSYKQAKECQAIQHCREKVWIMKPEDACQDCELVLNELKVILSKNTTQHEIVIYLEDLCSKLSGHASECKALVDVYAPIFIEQIRDFIVDTKKACVSLGLCAVKDKSTIMAAVLRNAIPHKNLVAILEPGPVLMQLKKKPSPDSNEKPASVLMKPVEKSSPLKKSDAGPLCFLCEFLMTELDRLISKNSTEQEIEAALEKVCSILPSTVRQECVEFVDTYAPAILEILLSELNPKMVCTTLGLCKARKVSKPAKKLQLKAQPTCVLCEYVMQELDTILGQNSTEEEIENVLEMVCSRLPSTVRSECDQYVKQYTPVIIKLLLDMKPSEICTAFGLCKSSKTLKASSLERVIRDLIKRFIKADVLQSASSPVKLLKIDFKDKRTGIDVEKLDVGFVAATKLKELQAAKKISDRQVQFLTWILPLVAIVGILVYRAHTKQNDYAITLIRGQPVRQCGTDDVPVDLEDYGITLIRGQPVCQCGTDDVPVDLEDVRQGQLYY